MFVDKKLKEWLKRYLPANIFATIMVLIVSWIIVLLTKNYILAAFIASIVETITYYSFILVRDVIYARKLSISKNRKYTFVSFLKNVRNLFLEFGVGEVLDTFIVRPFFLYFTPRLVRNYTIGLIIGKYVSDLIFYIPTIISYELRKKHLKD
jgi:hypothetical protein